MGGGGSYWSATAPLLDGLEPLERDLEVDVAVVGGGFTGLATAWHLMRRDRRCAVLEAGEIGAGASGTTGGQVVPRFKSTFPELERAYGRTTALAMHRIAHAGADLVERAVGELRIDCGYRRHGHVTPIQHPHDIDRFVADRDWLQREAGDLNPRILDQAAVARAVGSAIYRGGYLEPRGAALHPLAYCRGMARALAARGASIHPRTPVTSWTIDGDRVLVQVPGARVAAGKLVLATNAYGDLTAAGDAVRKRIVPILSSQVATAPLPEAVRATVLLDRNTATDAKRLTNYYRVMDDGRFVFGGRAGATNRESPAIFRRLQREMTHLFPQLEGVAVEFGWSGKVALTRDGLPHLGSLGDRVLYGMGYNGRGIGLAALFGERLAALAEGEPVDLGPLTAAPFSPFPFHSLHVPGKAVAIAGKRLLDALGL